MTPGGTFEWIPDEPHCFSVSRPMWKGIFLNLLLRLLSHDLYVDFGPHSTLSPQASRHTVWPLTRDGCVTHLTKGRQHLQCSTACFVNVSSTRNDKNKTQKWCGTSFPIASTHCPDDKSKCQLTQQAGNVCFERRLQEKHMLCLDSKTTVYTFLLLYQTELEYESMNKYNFTQDWSCVHKTQ